MGINTAIFSRSGGSQGVGFAVPINLARYVMERLITDGKVTRGYLGVVIQPVTEGLAKEFKLKDQEGALVGEVTAKSPAEEAGLKDGDVIVEFNGKKVSDSRHLRLMVAQTARVREVQDYLPAMLASPGDDAAEICAAYVKGYCLSFDFNRLSFNGGFGDRFRGNRRLGFHGHRRPGCFCRRGRNGSYRDRR